MWPNEGRRISMKRLGEGGRIGEGERASAYDKGDERPFADMPDAAEFERLPETN